MATSRWSGERSRTAVLVPALLLVGLVGALFVWLLRGQATDVDEDLCTAAPGGIAASAALLLDLRKPLDEPRLPGQLLRTLTVALAARSELRVFTVADDPATPRQPVARLCKPYANADLALATAKDGDGGLRDCDDLPAQLSPRVRGAAEAFCMRRDALHRRIDALAGGSVEDPVGSVYLVEAIEDTVLELAERPGPQALYVFSDMLQHADWYSHLDLEWTDWQFEDFAARRRERYGPPAQVESSDMQVVVFYVPRRQRTEQPRAKHAHQAFWRAYFRAARVTYDELPAMALYRSTPRMTVLSEAARIARARDEAARLLAQLEEEQAALAENRRRQAEELRRQQEELRRQEERLQRETESRDAAERERQAAAGRGAEPDGAEPEGGDAAGAAPAAAPDVEPARPRVPEAAPAEQPGASGRVPEPGARAAERDAAPPCDVQLAPRFDIADAAYPGRRHVDFGNADILVRYVLDESGATLDDAVAVDPDASTASRPQYFQLFAQAAMETVRQWEFVFEDDGACARPQRLATTFHFRRN